MAKVFYFTNNDILAAVSTHIPCNLLLPSTQHPPHGLFHSRAEELEN